MWPHSDMTRDDVLAICLNLPRAEETYPSGKEVALINVGGKMFALVPLSEEPGSVNLKCDPAWALELREAYPGIRPGYHQTSGTGTPWTSSARSRTTSCAAHRGLPRPGRRRAAASIRAELTPD